jgi:hypothetical protein
MPIASAPIKQVSIPAGPSLASLATPNSSFAAVSELPRAASGTAVVGGTAAAYATAPDSVLPVGSWVSAGGDGSALGVVLGWPLAGFGFAGKS